MIEEMVIKNFKKFDKIKLNNLGQINLIVGANNTGKTTILEAIFAFACGKNVMPMLLVSFFHRLQERNYTSNSPYRMAEATMNAFHKKDISIPFSFSFAGKVDGEEHKVRHTLYPGKVFADFLPTQMGSYGNDEVVVESTQIHGEFGAQMNHPVSSQELGILETLWDQEIIKNKLSYPVAIAPTQGYKPFKLAHFNDILSHRDERESRIIYSYLIRSGMAEQFRQEMNQSFTGMGIKSIENIPYPDGSAAPISFRMKDGNTYPLYTMGDGVRRWYSILGNMISYQNAVHCFEEIDVAFHHHAQASLAKQLVNYAEKYQNQIFMTTHNTEFLDTFLQAVRDSDPQILRTKVRVLTLRQDEEGSVKIRNLNGEEALMASQNGLELRV